MSLKSPVRTEIRTVKCPICAASPGHPCVVVRTTGQSGKHFGSTRDACHDERRVAFQSAKASEL